MLKDSQGSAEKQVSRHITHDPCSDQQNNVPEASVVDSGSVSTSSEVVHNLIERCLRLYMNRNEVVNTLLCRARIEPGFTTSLLQKLEEKNAEFFKAYYIRLKLKQQIHLFNYLLERQYQLLKHSSPQKVPLPPMQSGIHHTLVNNPRLEYPILQQPMGQPPSYLLGSMPSCHVVHGIPAPGNFNPTQINSGENMVDSSAIDTVPVIPTFSIMLENPSSLPSMASCGQFPFTSSEIAGLSMETSALDATYKLHVANAEELQLGPDGRTGQLKELQSSSQISWNFSVSDWPNLQDVGTLGNYLGSSIFPFDVDVLLDSAEQKYMVEDFFVDAVPSAGSHSEEGRP